MNKLAVLMPSMSSGWRNVYLLQEEETNFTEIFKKCTIKVVGED